MDHFYTEIHGWFNFEEVYSELVKSASDGCHFVEIGSWKGMSASFMAVEIINSGKNIKFDCVDTWEGSNEDFHINDSYIKEGSLYEHFLDNMKRVEGYYNPIRLPSLEAAKLYEDGSLDFVFIDGSHEYEDVKNDILAWKPKVKKGGILAGHDWQCPEVKQAVEEVLDYISGISNISWIYVV